MGVIEIVIGNRQAFLSGLRVTAVMCVIIWCVGSVVGFFLGLSAAKYKKTLGVLHTSLSVILGGVPVIVLLYWLYFPFQQLLQLTLDPFMLATTTLTCINALLVAKIVKSTLENLPPSYKQSAKLSGMSHAAIAMKIQLPLVIKSIIGPVIMLQITMMHSTIFASLINVDDLFRQIQRINAIVYKPIELYSLLALFFMLVSLPLYMLATHYTKKYRDVQITA